MADFRSIPKPPSIPEVVLDGVDFHMALADAVHNQILALMYRTIRDLYLETARRTRITPEAAQDRLRDHELWELMGTRRSLHRTRPGAE